MKLLQNKPFVIATVIFVGLLIYLLVNDPWLKNELGLNKSTAGSTGSGTTTPPAPATPTTTKLRSLAGVAPFLN